MASAVPAELEFLNHCFRGEISFEERAKYIANFAHDYTPACPGIWVYKYPSHGIPSLQSTTLPLTSRLRDLKPFQIPGIVIQCRLMDKVLELEALRRAEMREMEMYRNVYITLREQIPVHLFPSTSGCFSKDVFQFGFAAFREKAACSIHRTEPFSFSDWLNQIWSSGGYQEHE